VPKISTKKKILVVDDDRRWLEILSTKLNASQNWCITVKNSYEEASKLINAGTNFDLAIVNLNLKNSSPSLRNMEDEIGIDLLRKFKGKCPKRILLTNSKRIDELRNGYKADGLVDEVFSKNGWIGGNFVEKIKELMREPQTEGSTTQNSEPEDQKAEIGTQNILGGNQQFAETINNYTVVHSKDNS